MLVYLFVHLNTRASCEICFFVHLVRQISACVWGVCHLRGEMPSNIYASIRIVGVGHRARPVLVGGGSVCVEGCDIGQIWKIIHALKKKKN